MVDMFVPAIAVQNGSAVDVVKSSANSTVCGQIALVDIIASALPLPSPSPLSPSNEPAPGASPVGAKPMRPQPSVASATAIPSLTLGSYHPQRRRISAIVAA